MNIQDKIPAIKKRLRNGEPEGEIREELKREGFTQEQIDLVFQPHRYDMRSWYLVSSIILILVGVWFMALLIIAGGAVMFAMYYTERQRIEKERSL